MDQDPPQQLRLMPGDVVRIQYYSVETTEIAGIVVDGAGNLHVPLVGDVPVGGLTLQLAEARVEESLRELDRVVRVAIHVMNPNGQTATVVGAVAEPGRIQLVPGTRLATLISDAGGPVVVEGDGDMPAIAADLARSRLTRNGEVLPVSIARALEGDPRHNVLIHPGDHLYVPIGRGNTITVLGSVGSAGVIPFRRGIRITEALARAGGLTTRGDRRDIHIVRGDLSAPLVYRANLREIVNGDRPDVVLAAGDVVYVTEEHLATYQEILGRLTTFLSDAGTIASIVFLANSNNQ